MIENWRLLLPKLKKPMLIGSVSFRVIAKLIAAAEFSLTRPNTEREAMLAAFSKAILDFQPQLGGMAKTASLISLPA